MCVETQVKYITKIENIQGIWQSDSNLLDLRIISWSILRYLYMGKALSSCLVSQHLNNWVEWGNALTTTDTSKPGEPESAAQGGNSERIHWGTWEKKTKEEPKEQAKEEPAPESRKCGLWKFVSSRSFGEVFGSFSLISIKVCLRFMEGWNIPQMGLSKARLFRKGTYGGGHVEVPNDLTRFWSGRLWNPRSSTIFLNSIMVSGGCSPAYLWSSNLVYRSEISTRSLWQLEL